MYIFIMYLIVINALLKKKLAKVRFGWLEYKEYCFYYLYYWELTIKKMVDWSLLKGRRSFEK